MPSATARDFQRVAAALGFVRQAPDWQLFFKILRQLAVSPEQFDRLR
jgi:hypothetical protein